MSCNDFFQPYLAWLRQPAADSGVINIVKFQMSGHAFEPFPSAIYGAGALELQATASGETLLLANSCHFYIFGNKVGEMTFSEEYVRIFVPNGPLERHQEASGELIQAYTNYECRADGSLLCGNRFGKVIVTFINGSEAAPIM